MILGIDLSNRGQGGGRAHGVNFVSRLFDVPEAPDRAVVVAEPGLAQYFRPDPRLKVVSPPPAANWSRFLWQHRQLPLLAAENQCTHWLAASGIVPDRMPCAVATMFRNMLLFDTRERARYGMSVMRLRLELLRRSELASAARAHGHIFLSESAKTITEPQLSSEAHSAIIPHGVDDRFFSIEPRIRSMSDCSEQDPFRILYVSTVDVYKHQAEVAEAVARLRKEQSAVTARFVGSAYPPEGLRLSKTLERLDRHQEFLHYTGAQDYAAIQRSYQEADMFVFASSCETCPNILLEAMASGVPIAALKKQPNEEFAGDGAALFATFNPNDITAALGDLMSDHRRRERLSRLARARARTYTWERTVRSTLSFLRELPAA